MVTPAYHWASPPDQENWSEQQHPKGGNMTSRDFCYWLQGFLELRSLGPRSPEIDTQNIPGYQVEEIKKHLKMVFVTEIDPSHGDKKTQELLGDLHKIDPNLPGGSMIARC